jgi:hypothetical protein
VLGGFNDLAYSHPPETQSSRQTPSQHSQQ